MSTKHETEHRVSHERDVEEALTGCSPPVVQDQKPGDSDIVDWNGPDDPENPQNWYEFYTQRPRAVD